MWLIDDSCFLGVPGDTAGKTLDDAKAELQKACREKTLTLIVGNGLSLAAEYESNLVSPGPKGKQETWGDVVRRVYEEGPPPHEKSRANSLIIAQAIAKTAGGKKRLLDAIDAHQKNIAASRLHEMVASLEPRYIITTNYDLLLEKGVFKQCADKFQCHVRCELDYDPNPPTCDETIIFKMHGTFRPEVIYLDKGHYSGFDITGNDEVFEKGIVISESDYDNCTEELVKSEKRVGHEALFWKALQNTILVVGKGIIWEDLSFMYALRERAKWIESRRRPAYWLTTEGSDTNRLTLQNLEMTPITMQMPVQTSDDGGHYYFAYEHALEMLFPQLETQAASKLPAIKKAEVSIKHAPIAIAIGLAAYNTAGFPNSKGDKSEDKTVWQARTGLPADGRQNIGLEDYEQYAGGPALTALAVCSALLGASHQERRCALVSIIGTDTDGVSPDLAGTSIRKFCKDNGIDDDALVAQKGSSTWQSIILVHGATISEQSKPGEPVVHKLYGGQRLFLDMSSKLKLSEYSEDGYKQLAAMFRNDALKVVYLDKWLAHPDEGVGSDRDSHGFLSSDRARALLLEAAQSQRIDFVYESGSKGSTGFVVEESLKQVTNIFTAAFPCFYRYVASEIKEEANRIFGETHGAKSEGSMFDFKVERKRIDSMLSQCSLRSLEWVDVPESWATRIDGLLRKGAKRRWLIVTLHELGALAIDLSIPQTPKMKWFSDVGKVQQEDIKNTSGAGDTFRGALMFALLQEQTGSPQDFIEACVRFAVACASKRCGIHLVAVALQEFKTEGAQLWTAANLPHG